MKKALLLILILPFSLQNLNAQNTDEILDIFSKIKTELGLGESIQKHTISHKKKELSQLSSVELSIKLDSVINQVDGPNESSLTNNFKTEFSYDGEGELIEYKEYSYDTDLDEWVGTWRVSQGFETSDKFVIYGYDWNEQGNDWIYNLKYDINYNNEKVVEEIGYYWEDEATDWIQDSYITYEYDMNGNIASLIEGEIEYGIVI